MRLDEIAAAVAGLGGPRRGELSESAPGSGRGYREADSKSKHTHAHRTMVIQELVAAATPP